jgi:hypothetical protein
MNADASLPKRFVHFTAIAGLFIKLINFVLWCDRISKIFHKTNSSAVWYIAFVCFRIFHFDVLIRTHLIGLIF